MHQGSNFRSNFWELDFATTAGFDAVAAHIKEGQKSCKWLEDYLKARSRLEDEFAKKLIGITKVVSIDFGTTRASLEELRKQAEMEAVFHQTLATKLSERSQRLQEFREKQREERKEIENKMHQINRRKKELHAKMSSCKENYFSKCKQADKAESEFEKSKFSNKPKEVEKAKKHRDQTKTNSVKADDDYKISVKSIEECRLQWVSEHERSCNQLQEMEERRIGEMRSCVWLVANLTSELACKCDDAAETVRVVAERCNFADDVKLFSRERQTCIKPLSPVVYQSYYYNNSSHISGSATSTLSRGDVPIANNSAPVVAADYSFANSDYASIEETMASEQRRSNVGETLMFEAIYDYTPVNGDEIELRAGDRCSTTVEDEHEGDGGDAGWLRGRNLRTQLRGYFPRNYVSKIS